MIAVGDFFRLDWQAELAALPDPLLVLGNPPWVTNAAIGTLGGGNLPPKANVDRLRGIDALTGRANFDISEAMIRQYFRWLENRQGAVAVLCKTSVARKALAHAWAEGCPVDRAVLYRIDANRHFRVSADACLLYASFSGRPAPRARPRKCELYDTLDAPMPASSFGMHGDRLVSDMAQFERLRHLYAPRLGGWRSGVKHDCGRVFELSLQDGQYVNGLGERVSVEPEVVFPLLKSSDLAQGRAPRRHVLIPHRSMDESTERLRGSAPRAWRYLAAHAEAIGRRASTIYKKRPGFSIFGIGAYSFAPWKVAVAGLYKSLRFVPIGPMDGRPVLLDDTCYFFPCACEAECDALHELVSSAAAVGFWSSLAFWDAKRPITSRLLNALDLAALAKEQARWNPKTRRLAERQVNGYVEGWHQPTLFADG